MAGVGDLQVDGQATGHRIRLATSWWPRLIGLLTTRSLDNPCGLWIEPCASVHTMGMRYAIDVVFVRRDGTVAKVVPRLKPWRAAVCPGAASTLELRAGLADALALRPGMRVGIALAS